MNAHLIVFAIFLCFLLVKGKQRGCSKEKELERKEQGNARGRGTRRERRKERRGPYSSSALGENKKTHRFRFIPFLAVPLRVFKLIFSPKRIVLLKFDKKRARGTRIQTDQGWKLQSETCRSFFVVLARASEQTTAQLFLSAFKTRCAAYIHSKITF